MLCVRGRTLGIVHRRACHSPPVAWPQGRYSTQLFPGDGCLITKSDSDSVAKDLLDPQEARCYVQSLVVVFHFCIFALSSAM